MEVGMRLLQVLTVAALGLVLVAADDKKDDAKKDKEKLAGKWTIVSVTHDGKEDDKAKEEGTATFEGDELTIHLGGKDHKGTFKIDPDKKPKEIDITPGDGPEKDKVLQGIYSLDKDELKICITHDSAGSRPTELESKEGSKTLLIVFKKAK
jgi:uncharacterized protein (TIGR03067 family)